MTPEDEPTMFSKETMGQIMADLARSWKAAWDQTFHYATRCPNPLMRYARRRVHSPQHMGARRHLRNYLGRVGDWP